MKTYRVFLGLGSNLGERHQQLNRAVAEVKNIPSTRIVWASSVYETSPYGNPDQPAFLNAAVEIETELLPAELLAELKAIETRLGRKAAERWAPREIDLDILLYDGLVANEPEVAVPHPDLEKRRFVLIPLQELDPDVVHPVNGMTASELAAACRDTGRVVKTQYRIQW